MARNYVPRYHPPLGWCADNFTILNTLFTTRTEKLLKFPFFFLFWKIDHPHTMAYPMAYPIFCPYPHCPDALQTARNFHLDFSTIRFSVVFRGEKNSSCQDQKRQITTVAVTTWQLASSHEWHDYSIKIDRN